MAKECIGNHYNVECPHCGKINHYVDQLAAVWVPDKGKVYFQWPCNHCDEVVYYCAERVRDEDRSLEIKIFSYPKLPILKKEDSHGNQDLDM